MILVFNELMMCLQLVMDALFHRMEFVPGLGVGWVILAIAVIDLVITYLFGRTRA